MRIFSSLLLLALCSLSPAAQQKPAAHPSENAAAQSAREARKPAPPADEVQALRQDLARMRALVQQMQSNLAFVDTTQSPLKHQFQLEIDMWNTVIAQMERRLASMSH